MSSAYLHGISGNWHGERPTIKQEKLLQIDKEMPNRASNIEQIQTLMSGNLVLSCPIFSVYMTTE